MSKRAITPEQFFLEGYRRCIQDERFIEADIAERRARELSSKGSWRVAREYTKKAGGEDEVVAAAVMPFSGGENLGMSGVDAYLDIEDERLREARTKIDIVREDIVKALESIANKQYARLLLYRYICECVPSWEAVAEMMGRDRRTVCRWHDEALPLVEVPEKYLENAPQCPCLPI